MNPLTFKLELRFSEPQKPKHLGMVWNLLQSYAAVNGTVVEYPLKDRKRPDGLEVRLLVRERLGIPKDIVPWEK